MTKCDIVYFNKLRVLQAKQRKTKGRYIVVEMLVIGGIISLLAAALGSLLVLHIQRRSLMKTQLEHRAWESAQESRQQMWMVRQTKRMLELENRLTAQLQQLQREWQIWKSQDDARLEKLAQQLGETAGKLNLEKDLMRLPRVEETPLSVDGQRDYGAASWQLPSFYQADLSGHDLSYRYLGRVDLREAQLVGTNFFMADLSGACLVGADLSGANLSGANLAHADLRNAILTDANLLVADLHHAVLTGANLLGVHHLTPQQVYAAISDSTTQLDPEVDVTMPRLPGVQQILTHSTSSILISNRASEAAPLSPLPLNGSQPDLTTTGLQADMQENRRTEEVGTAIPTAKRNGKRRAERS